LGTKGKVYSRITELQIHIKASGYSAESSMKVGKVGWHSREMFMQEKFLKPSSKEPMSQKI
jgi:hypothetical protein